MMKTAFSSAVRLLYTSATVAKPFSSSEISFAGSDVCEELEDFATSEDEETGVSCDDEIADELV
jgi:hypothetical protein